ncbi:hypothetical protein [Clostridium rectalis]|uniref:hypothetical protein n=1 Tax=Clostridium rectalis TaxID=2040295 RepID=UPI000F634C26|nr:hypothetical protein [Clostridium rectalis]
MKILEMIDLIEKHDMAKIKIDKIRINKKITNENLLNECLLNKKYFLMLLEVKHRFDYLKDILKAHSKEVSDKQILYAVYLSESDPYLKDMTRNFDTITQKEMQELIRDFRNSADLIK